MNRTDQPLADNVHTIVAEWKGKVQQLGQQIIRQIDCKMTALQAITTEGNRTANRLEVFVEHLEQIAEKRIERQQQQFARYAAETAKSDPIEEAFANAVSEMKTTIPVTKTRKAKKLSLSDVLQEIAEITEDVEDVSKTIRWGTIFGDQTVPPDELPLVDLPRDVHEELETMLDYVAKPQEINPFLDVFPGESDSILHGQQNLDTIPNTITTPTSTMSDFDFDDGFIEADNTRSRVVTKTVSDDFKTPPAFKIGVVGVGQCGNNIAQAFYRIGYRRVLLVNTAQTDLDSIEDQIPKLAIDKQGAGKDPAVGKTRVEAKATEIRNGMLREFGEDFDKIIVCLGLGGGTGSGGGPAVIKLASDIIKDRGGNPAKDVIVVATLPDANVDGPRQCFNALVAYGQITNLGLPMIIIDNAQVGSIIRAKLADGWTPINMWIARTFHMFNAYANMPSDHGAFDGNDLNDVFSRGRLLFSAFRVSQRKDRYAIGDTMAANLERSLFAKCDRATATAAGCLMIINPRIGSDLSMEDIAPALKELNNIMRPNSTLHRGIYIPDWSALDRERHPDMFCYVILGGMEHPRVTLAGLFEKVKGYDQRYDSVEAFLAAEA